MSLEQLMRVMRERRPDVARAVDDLFEAVREEIAPPATARSAQKERRVDPGPIEKVGGDNMPPHDRRSRTRRLWDWLRADPPPPIPAYFGALEEPPRESDRTGICCSGGGVRSAAFNLGALQTLRKEGELQDADYVSAVSGGSYIAAAFATVGRRWGPAKPGDCPPSKGGDGYDDSDPRLFDDKTPPFYPGSPEEQYLRNRSSYMAPTGVAKLYLLLRLVGGLVWNVLFLGLALFAAGIAAGLFYRSYGFLDPGAGTDVIPRYGWGPPAVLISAGIALGWVFLVKRIESEDARRTMQAWIMRLLIAGGAAAIVLVAVPLLIIVLRSEDLLAQSPELGDPAVIATWASVATVLAGVAAQLRNGIDTHKERLAELDKARERWTKLGRRARMALVYTAAAVAVPLLALLGFTLAARWAVDESADIWPPAAGAAALALFMLAYFWCDLTTWSLHPYYKRRLATVFSLKRVKSGSPGDTRGVAAERDYDALPTIKDADIHRDGDPWPVLIVCAAANVSDPGATPPGRSVTSFTFSPGAIGGPLVGAVGPDEFKSGVDPKSTQRQISLMTAVAVSGAALSPSMGKETRWSLRALMALANIRLGVWMRNPRRLDATHTRLRPRPVYLLAELLGRNSVNDKFLYVTDGGHYENLGLVELLRRGCTRIYCLDASGGTSCAALGDAIALARSEVGVEIDIDPSALIPDEDSFAESDCVVGDITYPPATSGGQKRCGKLVYVRTVVTKDAPYDVRAFHEDDPLFPNHPTTDQLYDDQKFEAYRALGASAAGRAKDALVAAGTTDSESGAPTRTDNGQVVKTTFFGLSQTSTTR